MCEPAKFSIICHGRHKISDAITHYLPCGLAYYQPAQKMSPSAEEPMRNYTHNANEVKNLFTTVLTQLSSSTTHSEIIRGILEDVCKHFRFGRGLIYEADYTGTLHLKEYYTLYKDQGALPETLRLKDYLSPEALDCLTVSRFFISSHRPSCQLDISSLTLFFRANSFLAVPVLGKENELIGLVIMFDRRRKILLDEDSVSAAKTVLNLVANHIKLRHAHDQLEYARRSMIDILDNMGMDIYVNDLETHEILYVNRSMADPYGGPENIIGKKCWQAIYDDKIGKCNDWPQDKDVTVDGQSGAINSWDYQRDSDGSWFRVLSTTFRWFDGRKARIISRMDITKNKKNEDLICLLAEYDPLTRLPNRRKMVADCELALKRLKETGSGEAWLLFFDLDSFKKVNDKLGHRIGDALLEAIGRLLEEMPATKNHCYRLGGDEFVIFYENMPRFKIEEIIRFILTRFKAPWALENHHPICQASIGASRYPTDGDTAEALIHKADMAMYLAKKRGKGRACFSTGECFIVDDSTGEIVADKEKT